MTDEQLAAIEARVQAATKGPWMVTTVGEPDGRIHRMLARPSYPERAYPWDQNLYSEADWNFIAHARQDIPALIAEVKRLRTLAEAFQERDNS